MPLPSISLEPLEAETFAPFGTVTQAPRPLTSSPLINGVSPVSANQGTAQKYSSVAPLTNQYGSSSSPSTARSILSMFVCHPRRLTTEAETASRGGLAGTTILQQGVLERHPYTTQTFSPLALDRDHGGRAFVVMVAPTDKHNPQGDGVGPGTMRSGPPDVRRARAFLGSGDQAVTYGAGTWHAPMAVVGSAPVSFLVAQYVNGVAEDDCQEWHAAQGEELRVDVGGLAKAKL